jgi:thiamine-phosphate pyrophosphorylase
MKYDRESLLLYAVTDRYWLKNRTLLDEVESTLRGGTTFLQLREKNLEEEKFLKEAIEIQNLCKKYRVPFVINDNVDIAVTIDADGVHVGQEDMSVDEVRKKLGPNKIIGVSVTTVNQAILAERQGADYLGVGAVFPTESKNDAKNVSFDTLKAICQAISIPVVAIGGITKENIWKLQESGISGVAVISAIFAQNNIEAATKELKGIIEQVITL